MSVDGRGPGDGSGRDSLLLARICQACVRSIPVAGASVSVMTAEGHRGVVFATGETSTRLEDLQFGVGQGPGVDAFAEGCAVLVADLSADVRWPVFAAGAGDLDVAAVFAFPLRLGAAVLGVMTLFRREAGGLDDRGLARAVRLAEAASLALLDRLGGIAVADVDAGVEEGDVATASAEFFRSEVYQAAGMVMVQLGVSIETAMVRVRAYAYSSGRTTAEVAHDIVTRKLRMQVDDD